MGVLTLVRLELEAGGDLGVPLRELRSHPAEEGELALVVVEQVVTHRRLP